MKKINRIMVGLIVVMLVVMIFITVEIQNIENKVIRQDITILLDMAEDKPNLCKSSIWRSEVDLRIDDLSNNLWRK